MGSWSVSGAPRLCSPLLEYLLDSFQALFLFKCNWHHAILTTLRFLSEERKSWGDHFFSPMLPLSTACCDCSTSSIFKGTTQSLTSCLFFPPEQNRMSPVIFTMAGHKRKYQFALILLQVVERGKHRFRSHVIAGHSLTNTKDQMCWNVPQIPA